MALQKLANSARVLLLMLLTTSMALEVLAEDKVSGKTGQSVDTAPWENISDELFKRLEVYDMTPAHIRRCLGMAITPTGEIFILASKNHGVCVSKDHGATWSVIEGNKVTGRCESGFGFSIAYPFDGRLAFFCIDGTGGMTLDGAKTWRPFTKLLRMFDFADVDWSAKVPQTIFGLTHEPYFTTLSTDGGSSWQQIYKDTEAPNDAQKSVKQYRLGIIDANTLVRFHPDQAAGAENGGIAMTKDAGKTWTEVAEYKVLGRRPVHYGKKVYWTTTEGVIVTENGKNWALVGSGLDQATFGPYFGESEAEMMVVTEKGFFVTRDGAKTWKNVAPFFVAPDGKAKRFDKSGSFFYFGWDSAGNILYASQLGGSCYRLKLQTQ